jgi:peptidoglycan hydrolase-like protein with peptidoglycan-binding domain
MRYKEILEACWTGYRRKPGTTEYSKGSCEEISEQDLVEKISNSDQVRRIQQLLNKEYNANLDIDGEMGPLTMQSIKKFLPAAGVKDAPNPGRNTAVQGYEKKLSTQELEENLRDWFKDKWVRFGPDGKIRGDCARGSSKEGKPKCLPQAKAHALGKKGRASAAARKRREDPNPNRTGKAINVATKKK